MIFISRYLAKAEENRYDFTEKVALSFALRGNINNIGDFTKEELEALKLLWANSYFEAYKGNSRKIIDKRYKAQKDFNQWIVNGNNQARQEAVRRLKSGLIVTLIFIAFVTLLYYGHEQSINNPNYYNSQ
ncbi:MAG TPA: hypothetical protein VII94_02670 [Candidatus Saccharimonadales bacterium]